MHRRFVFFMLFALAWMVCAGTTQASSSLRVGNRLLVVGDTAARVQELLGRPAYHARRGRRSRGQGRRRRRGGAAGANSGERWQYRRDGQVIVVTLVDGVVSDIEEQRD